MQHRHSTPYPPPDVYPPPVEPISQTPSSRPDFLIIGLFALRLTKRLIETLEYYPERDVDINWLANFLESYHSDYDLAKISGNKKQQYLEMYPVIVSRMKRQLHDPIRLMQVNPVASERHNGIRNQSGITDSQRLEMINFSDAALEWGSVVLLPAHEMERMVALGDQRRIADVDGGRRRSSVEPREQARVPSQAQANMFRR